MRKTLIFSYFMAATTFTLQASYPVTDVDLLELRTFCTKLTEAHSRDTLGGMGIYSDVPYADKYSFTATSGVQFQFKIQDFQNSEASFNRNLVVDDTYKSYTLDDFKAPVEVRKFLGKIRKNTFEKYGEELLLALSHPDLKPKIKDNNFEISVTLSQNSEEFSVGMIKASNLSMLPLSIRYSSPDNSKNLYGVFARYENPYHPQFGQEAFLGAFRVQQVEKDF